MQKVTFCGVGAHHQNGVAENTINQLTLTSRTLLVHNYDVAARIWDQAPSSYAAATMSYPPDPKVMA